MTPPALAPHAIVGPAATVDALARRWVQARAVPLPQDLALVPLTDALLDDIAELTAGSPHAGYVTGAPVPDGVALVAREASAAGLLAWLRREGDTAGAVVWERGRVVLGPLDGADALDAALRHLGAWARPGESVVDALGLRWTSTQDLSGRGI